MGRYIFESNVDSSMVYGSLAQLLRDLKSVQMLDLLLRYRYFITKKMKWTRSAHTEGPRSMSDASNFLSHKRSQLKIDLRI
jgi:hypothetical protein